ncbi:MAG: glycosyltransferase family 2 protein [Candidatus Shapirobacteria bacterium]|jgi:hypothetical protein
MSIVNKISIVIVNYNSTKKLNTLLVSLLYIQKIISDIVIIDNNSQDIELIEKPKLLRQKITLHRKNYNLGFSKAVNIGIKITKTENILLLNPDTKLIDNSVLRLVAFYLSNKKIGIIGGRLISEETGNFLNTANKFKPSFLSILAVMTNLQKIFPNSTYVRNFFYDKDTDIKKPVEVDSLCGAFMLFRKHSGKQINYFDEVFFLYLEDIDFCLQRKAKNFKVFLYPQAQIMHYGGFSSNSKYRISLRHWYNSRKVFSRKYLNHYENAFINFLFFIEKSFLSLYHNLKNEPQE